MASAYCSAVAPLVLVTKGRTHSATNTTSQMQSETLPKKNEKKVEEKKQVDP